MIPALTITSGSTQHHLRDPLRPLRQTLEPSAPPTTRTGKESVLCPRILQGHELTYAKQLGEARIECRVMGRDLCVRRRDRVAAQELMGVSLGADVYYPLEVGEFVEADSDSAEASGDDRSTLERIVGYLDERQVDYVVYTRRNARDCASSDVYYRNPRNGPVSTYEIWQDLEQMGISVPSWRARKERMEAIEAGRRQ